MSEKNEETENFTAERIRLLRLSCKRTQKEVAGKLDVTQQKYSRIERGITPVDSEMVKRLCAYYDVSADVLLGIRKKEEPKQEPEPESMGLNEKEENLEICLNVLKEYQKDEGDKQ